VSAAVVVVVSGSSPSGLVVQPIAQNRLMPFCFAALAERQFERAQWNLRGSAGVKVGWTHVERRAHHLAGIGVPGTVLFVRDVTGKLLAWGLVHIVGLRGRR
jgi:hypothetical protein